jgi:hypothetical protein
MLILHFTLDLDNESGSYQTCFYFDLNSVQCERRKVTSLYSISGEHEFKWYLQMDLL